MKVAPRPQRQATLWLALIPLLLVVQLIYPSKVWVALLVGLAGAWLIAYAWARLLAGGLHLNREMRYGWAHVGDRLEERFTLINHSLAPALWVEISDFSTLPDYAVSQVTAIGGESRLSWKTNQVCAQRGLFTLGPTRISSGDPLGFFRVTIDLPGSAVLMVTPPVIPLPSIEVSPGGRAGVTLADVVASRRSSWIDPSSRLLDIATGGCPKSIDPDRALRDAG